MKLRYLFTPLSRVPQPHRDRIETGIWAAWGLGAGIAIGMVIGLVRFLNDALGSV